MTIKFQFIDTSPEPEKYCGILVKDIQSYELKKKEISHAILLKNSIEEIIHHAEKYGGTVDPILKKLYEKSKEFSS